MEIFKKKIEGSWLDDVSTVVKRMAFKNFVFHKGLNLTVRNGVKWKCLNPGERIILAAKSKEHILRDAVVDGILCCRFKDISDEDLACEHDVKCRTKKGLKKELESIYGKITKDTILTMVMFKVKDI